LIKYGGPVQESERTMSKSLNKPNILLVSVRAWTVDADCRKKPVCAKIMVE
jgi:hypothetical protein